MKKDCAFSSGRKCAVLTRYTCAWCSFYKTRQQLDEGRKKAAERLKTLPDTKQMYITAKYYEGLE